MSLNQRTISSFSIVTLAVACSFSTAAQAQSGPASVLSKAHPDWIQVPGALIRPDCVHEIPKGAELADWRTKVRGVARAAA